MLTYLSIGAGYNPCFILNGFPTADQVLTLDRDTDTHPDILWDLDVLPYPVKDELADVIFASHVLEHCGTQGDWRFWFEQWSEFHRILKPEGLFVAQVPATGSPWVWGDPGHTRTITPESLVFLDQDHYRARVGHSHSSDYRKVWKDHLKTVWWTMDAENFTFILRKTAWEGQEATPAEKPSIPTGHAATSPLAPLEAV